MPGWTRPTSSPAGGTGRLAIPSVLLLAVLCAGPVQAQDRVEHLSYRNPADGTPLSATLHLPEGPGPFPSAILLSLAGVDGLVDRMQGMGWAVVVPERRGMGGAPELQLRATFEDLARDVAAVRAHLASRPDIDGAAVGLVAQGGETTVGALAAVEPPLPSFLVLVSPRGMAGDEIFAIQQERSAESRGLDAGERAALERQVEEIAAIVRSSSSASLRAYRLRALLTGAPVRPHQSSSLPAELEGQVRFLSSTWWHDWFTLAPTEALARLSIPALVLEGERPYLPPERNLPPVRDALASAPTDDATFCLVPGRLEHTFPAAALDALEAWLRVRGPTGGTGLRARPGADPPGPCLEEPTDR